MRSGLSSRVVLSATERMASVRVPRHPSLVNSRQTVHERNRPSGDHIGFELGPTNASAATTGADTNVPDVKSNPAVRICDGRELLVHAYSPPDALMPRDQGNDPMLVRTRSGSDAAARGSKR